MTAALVMSITDELVAELEKEAWLCDSDTSMFMEPAVVVALLAERAELKRDAARYRWLREGLVGASFDWDGEGMTVIVFQMPDSITVSANCDKVVDDAMQATQ